VRAGLITQDQLVAAHEQRRRGEGTLTEVLIAMGALNEEALVGFYRQRLLVPRVGWNELAKIPPRVIAKLPPELAGEFRVIPLELDREGNLTVAMADPSDTHAVDEVGFFTGAFVMRAVATPSVIAWGLYHYYKIPTPLLPKLMARFPGAPPQAVQQGAVTLVSEQLPANRPPQAAAPTPAPAPTPAAAPTPVRRVSGPTATTLVPPMSPAPAPPALEPLAATSGEIKARPTKPQAVVVPDDVPVAVSETPSGAAILLDRPRRDAGEAKVIVTLEELTAPAAPAPKAKARPSKPQAMIVADEFGEDTPIPAPVPMDITGQQFLLDPELPPPAPPPPTVGAQTALTGALETLRFAQDRDAVTGALVTYMGRLCRRAAFFAVKKGEINGWQGLGPGIRDDELRKAILRLDRPSTLREIVQARLPYRGPLGDSATRDFLIEALGGWAPDHALLVPLALRERVVGLLYGDDELEPVPDEHVRLLMAEAASALETVLVARKTS
jgi:hypothetical protein